MIFAVDCLPVNYDARVEKYSYISDLNFGCNNLIKVNFT